MGEVIDIDKNNGLRRLHDEYCADVFVPAMLSGTIDLQDPHSEKGGDEIVRAYQMDILTGADATRALVKAIVRARRIP